MVLFKFSLYFFRKNQVELCDTFSAVKSSGVDTCVSKLLETFDFFKFMF